MKRSALIGLLAAALLVACRPSQTVEGQTEDVKIKTAIKTKLATDVGAATLTSVDVNVTAGVVTLSGPVSSEDDKNRIDGVVRSVEGVVSVSNNLQVLVQPQIVTPAVDLAAPRTPTAAP